MHCQLPDILLSCAMRPESRIVYMQDQGQLFCFCFCFCFCLALQSGSWVLFDVGYMQHGAVLVKFKCTWLTLTLVCLHQAHVHVHVHVPLCIVHCALWVFGFW